MSLWAVFFRGPCEDIPVRTWRREAGFSPQPSIRQIKSEPVHAHVCAIVLFHRRWRRRSRAWPSSWGRDPHGQERKNEWKEGRGKKKIQNERTNKKCSKIYVQQLKEKQRHLLSLKKKVCSLAIMCRYTTREHR